MIWAIDLLNSPLEKHPLTLQISDDLHFKSTAMQKKFRRYDRRRRFFANRALTWHLKEVKDLNHYPLKDVFWEKINVGEI